MNASALHSSQLDSWASSLGFLADGVVPGIEQMSRRLNLAMSEEALLAVGSAEPNGYAGLSRRGDFGRLLLSDWALADAEPAEFMRRLVAAELSFLELEFHEPRPPSQIAVLVDSGPDQLGARRLAQLAGLVVLDRRARALGVPMTLGIMGDEPSAWQTEELPELFMTWLRSRRPTRPERSAVQDRLADLPTDATVWLFGAAHLSTDELGRGVRRLSATESNWGPDGATELEVIVDRRTVTLVLPERSTGLRLLRGHGLRRREQTAISGASGALRFPSFHGSVRRLLCRGDGDDELVVVRIPQSADGEAGGRKRRRFPGPVLAASLIGQRTVALVATAGSIHVVVIGKHLGKVDTIDLVPSELGLDDHTINEISASRLEPLYFASGSIVARIGEQWWSIQPPGNVAEPLYTGAAASSVSDQPRFVYSSGSGIYVDGRMIHGVRADARVLLGPRRAVAVETEPGMWDVSGPHTDRIEVDPNATVCGLTCIHDEPTLVVQSARGHLLRLVRFVGTKTLTKLSRDVALVQVHPTLPLAVIQRLDGSIDVVDLEAVEIITRIRAERS